jgi:hypothetical protein
MEMRTKEQSQTWYRDQHTALTSQHELTQQKYYIDWQQMCHVRYSLKYCCVFFKFLEILAGFISKVIITNSCIIRNVLATTV